MRPVICNGIESWGGGSTAVQLINHNGLTSAPNTVLCDSYSKGPRGVLHVWPQVV